MHVRKKKFDKHSYSRKNLPVSKEYHENERSHNKDCPQTLLIKGIQGNIDERDRSGSGNIQTCDISSF